MSWQAVAAVLDAEFSDMVAGPGRRFGVSRQVLKLVALTIADPADQDGADGHPGLRRMARRSSSSVATVRVALDALIELGVVRLAEPSDGRKPDRYDLDLAALAALEKQPVSARATRTPPNPVSARATRTLPTGGHSRASARATRTVAREPLARDCPSVHTPAFEPPPLRLAASTPPIDERQRVAAILAEQAEQSSNPDLFGRKYRDVLDPTAAAEAWERKNNRAAGGGR